MKFRIAITFLIIINSFTSKGDCDLSTITENIIGKFRYSFATGDIQSQFSRGAPAIYCNRFLTEVNPKYSGVEFLIENTHVGDEVKIIFSHRNAYSNRGIKKKLFNIYKLVVSSDNKNCYKFLLLVDYLLKNDLSEKFIDGKDVELDPSIINDILSEKFLSPTNKEIIKNVLNKKIYRNVMSIDSTQGKYPGDQFYYLQNDILYLYNSDTIIFSMEKIKYIIPLTENHFFLFDTDSTFYCYDNHTKHLNEKTNLANGEAIVKNYFILYEDKEYKYVLFKSISYNHSIVTEEKFIYFPDTNKLIKNLDDKILEWK